MFKAFGAPTGDIVDTAAASGRFGRLLNAVEAAGLAPELRNEGPYTVFAPSDEAFVRLPQAVLEAVLADGDRLAAMLKNHIIAGRLSSSDLARIPSVRSLHGERLALATRPGVTVNEVRVGVSDIEATNGVIHVIDEVLIPG